MRTTGWLALALAAGMFGTSARAQNAAAALLPGDRLHGNILAQGDFDDLSMYLPAGTALSVTLVPEKDSPLHPGLVVLGPDDEPLDLASYTTPVGAFGLRIRKAPAGPVGGTFTFRVTGEGPTSGRYSFQATAVMMKKFTAAPTIGPGNSGAIEFDAPAGSKLTYAVKALTAGATVTAGPITAPDLSTITLNALTGRNIPLGQDGTWSLPANNTGAAPADVSLQVSLTLPKGSRRDLYLSPLGFGPAPKVLSVTPSKVLDDRLAPGIAIAGEGFEEGSTVRLERTGKDPLSPTSFQFTSPTAATADFDPTSVDAGGWNLVVENPSGGRGVRRFTIQAAGQVKLPPGVIEGSEVWWLEFDGNAFRDDLALMGLGSSNPTMASLVEGAVKSYALYHARAAFGIEGVNGKLTTGDPTLSFILAKPPSTVGTPGVGYDRLRIGGTAGGSDPSSNPNYPWGNGALDAGNAQYDDLSEDGGVGLGLRSRALQPTLATGTAGWIAALKPLLDNPLTASDAGYFGLDVNFSTPEQAARYRDIVTAVNAAGREIGGTIAHFVARSMGVADGVSGISAVPQKVGEYSGLVNFAFSGAETSLLAGVERTGLPGKSKTLHAATFPPLDTRPYVLPNAVSTHAYSEAFEITGGRPDRTSGETSFTFLAGTLPQGFALSNSGVVSGTAPLRDAQNQLVGGVFRILVRFRDSSSGEEILFTHRINLLVDTANPALTPAEVALGTQKNSQTLSTP